jgi:cobalt/nickel transport protein
MTRFQKKLWAGLIVLALLTPAGILLPRLFKAGGAWGEWGTDELKGLVGYVPEGLKRLGELWKAPIAGYGSGASSSTTEIIMYIVSALIGLALAAAVVYLISRAVARRAGNEK